MSLVNFACRKMLSTKVKLTLSVLTVLEHTFIHKQLFFSDINECTANSHSCDVNAVCQNTVGSHTCSCKAGYGGNGNTCHGKMRGSQCFPIWTVDVKILELLTVDGYN